MTSTKMLAVSKPEAEMIMDAFKVSNPLSRPLILKLMGIVAEFATEEIVMSAARAAAEKAVDVATPPTREVGRRPDETWAQYSKRLLATVDEGTPHAQEG